MKIHYGMAQWQHLAWVDWLYPSSLATGQRIGRYSEFFSTVEVGSTFYTSVSQEQLMKWFRSVNESFKFSFKAPQTVTHQLADRPWVEVLQDWQFFMSSLEPLAPKLGPTMLQFPSNLDERSIEKIFALCDLWVLPTPLSVEVRHLSFFDKGEVERGLLSGLARRSVNRVIMDSRPVFSTEAYCESLIDAQSKKPKVPCHPVNTAQHPVVRFIGHPDLPSNALWLDQWAKKLASWLVEGLSPYVFVHSSDNVAAPTLAVQLDKKVAEILPDYQSQLHLPDVQEQISLY
ncbi:DUF72 domain-containing protein [Marinomonas sp. C2222]|uniref:DUF72 domain-containing protein n=1 Tax=Marinomonas sargassi TaxID=2984494 RepID=A0ABT2YUD1_9GAMM|nr:DUF72 domain-containing protein [Marinomonas sargassi]MCV2403466.1 DUF72 domain-containing protein [Marinomonas sargassi]